LKNALVTDTSVLYAALDASERHHERCAELVTSGDVVTLPAPVVTETTMFSRSRGNPRAVDAVLEGVLEGTMVVVDLEWVDYARARQLVAKYASLALSFVDASVVAIAERLQETTIATLDHKHFSVVRPLHCERFTLVP
jgi:predicted nucleic acid-binding protein